MSDSSGKRPAKRAMQEIREALNRRRQGSLEAKCAKLLYKAQGVTRSRIPDDPTFAGFAAAYDFPLQFVTQPGTKLPLYKFFDRPERQPAVELFDEILKQFSIVNGTEQVGLVIESPVVRYGLVMLDAPQTPVGVAAVTVTLALGKVRSVCRFDRVVEALGGR